MWLTSKFDHPLPLPRAVARPRLSALLDRWPKQRIILIRAAAGYGKSSLVAGWLATRKTDAAATRVAWLSLDPEDSDPLRFIRYLAAAIDRAQPGLLDAVLSVLDDARPDPTHAMLALLAAIGQTDAPPLLLILDDYHRADSPPINALLDLLLERAAARVHVMILSRTLPGLALARFVLDGSLLELTADDLRFSRAELAEFMANQGSHTLAADELDALLHQTEGWIAGAKLAAISMTHDGGAAELPAGTPDTHRWQAEYLTTEVLNRQSPTMRRFLLQTSILNRFDIGLCAAVTGRADAGLLVKEAFDRGLFLIPLDKQLSTFRYHHLFQEVLLARLEIEETLDTIRQLHQRAADYHAAAWARGHGPLDYESGDAGLRHYLAAEEVAAAAAMIAQLARQAIDAHDLHQADLWLGRLPNGELDRQPELLLLLCDLNARRTEPTLAATVTRTERGLGHLLPDDPARQVMEARLSVYQALAAFNQRRLTVLRECVERAARGEQHLTDFERAVLRLMQFEDAVLGIMEPERADELALLAVAAFIQAGFTPGVITTRQEMAVRLMYGGRPAEAARGLEQLIAAYPSPQPNYVLRELQYTHLQAAETYYWMNDLELSRRHAVRGAQLGRELDDENAIIIAAQLLDLHNLANPAAPELGYQRPRPLNVDDAGVFSFNPEIEIILQVALGNSQTAYVLACVPNDEQQAPHDMAPSRLVSYVLARTAAGHDLPALDDLVALGMKRFAEDDLGYFLVRLQAAEAWRQAQMGNRAAATRILEQAVVRGEQTGMVRHILDLPALGPLLSKVTHPLARKMSMWMDQGQTSAAGRISQLTPREHDVLILLMKDYRYADIATTLNISLDTTRWHIKRIYRKLGVNGRLAAITIANQAMSG